MAAEDVIADVSTVPLWDRPALHGLHCGQPVDEKEVAAWKDGRELLRTIKPHVTTKAAAIAPNAEDMQHERSFKLSVNYIILTTEGVSQTPFSTRCNYSNNPP